MNIFSLRHLLLVALLASGSVFANEKAQEPAAPVDPLQGLLEQIGQYKGSEQAIDKAREAAFRKDLAEQKRLLAEIKEELKREQKLADELKKRFDTNEKKLTEREEELRVRIGSLGEMFGVVRQTAGDLIAVLDDSLTNVEVPVRKADLKKLAAAKELPTINELEALWFTLQHEMSINGAISTFEAAAIAPNGEPDTRTVTRLGVFNTIDSEGYLTFDTGLKQLQELAIQPSEASMARRYLNSKDEVAVVAVDPSRGALLTMTLEKPDLWERIQQGEEVGYSIMLLGLIGFGIAAWRLMYLEKVSRLVRAQQQNIQNPNLNNPLGRVMQCYQDLPRPIDIEVLDAKMSEAVLKEIPALERGQTIIKLFASVAPLLGLLGTVTGMIATFQAITTFGTGDPKLMAGGISQALVTTVQGLLVAIPLLLLHNWVSARSKAVTHLLDEQSAGLIATELEQQQKRGQ